MDLRTISTGLNIIGGFLGIAATLASQQSSEETMKKQIDERIAELMKEDK